MAPLRPLRIVKKKEVGYCSCNAFGFGFVAICLVVAPQIWISLNGIAHVGETIDLPVQSTTTSTSPPSPPTKTCRVVIENQCDYHHEILESIVHRFPLPHLMLQNCSQLQFDFSLIEHLFPDRFRFVVSPKPTMLEETEYWGWKEYYQTKLQYTSIIREVDGIPAYYGNIVTYDDYNNLAIDAIVDATCEARPAFIRAFKDRTNFFCVLHRVRSEIFNSDPAVQGLLNRSCWLSPMHGPKHCYFLPTHLPRLDEVVDARQTSPTVHICVSGYGRNETDLFQLVLDAGMSKDTTNSTYPLQLTFTSRFPKKYILERAAELGIPSTHVQYRYEKDFQSFYQTLASCDILLPGIEPGTQPQYFPHSKEKRLSGAVGVLDSYQIAAIMHQDFESIYHDFWTGAVETYQESAFANRLDALKLLVKRVVATKQKRPLAY